MRLRLGGPFGGVLIALLTACAGSDPTPARLLDGSPARPPPVELDGVPVTAVLTRVRVRGASEIEPRSPAAECLRRAAPLSAEGAVVERVGVVGASITFRDVSGRGLHACDRAGHEEKGRTWCGAAYGLLSHGRLPHPRVSLACRSDSGRTLAAMWVEPGIRAEWVVATQKGYAEVYPARAGLPVRVWTAEDVDVARSRARIDISEHDRSGRLLRRYELEAAVAG